MPRLHYVIDLNAVRPQVASPDGVATRRPTPADVEALARLMDDAYRGTIDYEGESLDEARAEVSRFFGHAPLLECSRVGLVEGSVVSASLISVWDGVPLVAYVMTAAEWKNSGLAAYLLDLSLEALGRTRHPEVHAWITEGNIPSETIFLRAGFNLA